MSKVEADDLKKISTSFLNKHEYFTGWKSGTITWTSGGMWGESKSSVGIEVSTLNAENFLRIHYTQTDNNSGEKKDFNYKISLTFTECKFGGKRYWFICPWSKNGTYCGKRVATLYKDGDYFACRHCYELTYSSRKVNKRYKLYPLFRTIELSDEIEKLQAITKRYTYNGKPTKKQQKLSRLYKQSYGNYEDFQRAEKGLISKKKGRGI